MNRFEDILTEGKPNSLGRTEEVIAQVLEDQSKLKPLFECLFSENEWVRMRAGDALEKVCRVHPGWLEPYTDRLLGEVAAIDQPSVQWHLAEILEKINLSTQKKKQAINWLKQRLNEDKPDWIVTRRCMETLVTFVQQGDISTKTVGLLIKKQTNHYSKSTARVARNLLEELHNLEA